MGYPDLFSTKHDPRTAAVSIGVDGRRHANQPARLAPDVSDCGQVVFERRSAIQYCIRNDLI